MASENRTIVVKVGGTQGVDFSAVCRDVANLVAAGRRIVLVHGGSVEANQLGERLGCPPHFITSPSGFSSRYTDRSTLEIFAMAVNGKLNLLLVEGLQRLGINAFGLSGVDGRLLQASRKESIVSVENGKRKVMRGDYTGKIEKVEAGLLGCLLESGLTPVIAPLAISPLGEPLNVDADRAAAMIASAMNAEALLLLTGAPGLMQHFPDESSLVKNLERGRLKDAMAYAQGRMKKKVLGAQEALQGGVGRVVIGYGGGESPVSAALSGCGTVIC